jgi:hypothetical protein
LALVDLALGPGDVFEKHKRTLGGTAETGENIHAAQQHSTRINARPHCCGGVGLGGVVGAT